MHWPSPVALATADSLRGSSAARLFSENGNSGRRGSHPRRGGRRLDSLRREATPSAWHPQRTQDDDGLRLAASCRMTRSSPRQLAAPTSGRGCPRSGATTNYNNKDPQYQSGVRFHVFGFTTVLVLRPWRDGHAHVAVRLRRRAVCNRALLCHAATRCAAKSPRALLPSFLAKHLLPKTPYWQNNITESAKLYDFFYLANSCMCYYCRATV